MSEHHASDPLSVEKPSQPPPAHDSVTSEGELPAGAERRKTKDAPAMKRTRQTRPEIPSRVSLDDVDIKRDKVYTQEEKTKAWSDAAGMVQTYSDEMVKRWKEEIDTYLVFAGLFSAVLTTFNVQSYLLLQPAAPDPSIAVLQQISSQLASFSIHPPFVNSTQPSSTTRANSSTAPPVPRWAVWLNTLWFSGLILSLASASVGIMTKQWLNEYSSGVSGTSRHIARVRLHRLNNMRRWHVEDVINTIPVLLQLALALFLAGLLILLWGLHDTVAAIASTLVGLLGVFIVVTTISPLFDQNCSFLTPQIRTLHSLWQPKCFVFWLYARTTQCATWVYARTSQCATWLYDRTSQCAAWLECWPSVWLIAVMVTGEIMAAAGRLEGMHRCLKEFQVRPPPESWRERKQTWQGRERSAIDNLAWGLDTQTLVKAYSTTLSPDALSAASVCLMDVRSDDVVDYFQQLHKSAREHFGPMADFPFGPLGSENEQQLLWLQIILCVLWQDNLRLSGDEASALGVYFHWGSWPSGMQAVDAEWAVSTCNAISDHLQTKGPSFALNFIDQERLESGRRYLLDRAMRRKKPLINVLLLGVTGAYREVRLSQSHLAAAPSDDTKDAHTRYLKSVDHFLECTNLALTSSLLVNDLLTICAYTGDVLAELTRVLLNVFAADRSQFVRTIVDAGALWNVMHRLAWVVSNGVLQCISDDLRTDILLMTDALATHHDHDDDDWGRDIQRFSRYLKAKIIRIKGEPDIATKLGESSAGPSGTGAAASSDLAVSPNSAVADSLSGAVADPGDSLQEPHASPPETVSS
ncbi:hypothetical protein VTO73DRAFT_2399 [Trametes versicolor]